MLKTSGLFFLFLSGSPLLAQDIGFTVPVTLSAGAIYTHRLQSGDAQAAPAAAAFRAMVYPSVKLGSRWFVSSAIQVHSSPYFYFESYDDEREIETGILQALVGYTRSGEKNSFTFKAGQLTSAFGSFPLRYDDAVNSLIDAPLSYGSSEYGFFPVTLYGLPGAQVDANLGRADARFQFTNSSPANAKNLLSSDQNPNWTAGAGYTIRQGFRVGASAYRGAYLVVGRFLLPTENTRDWPATAIGVDFQWARGRWSANGEWQRFHLPYPRYRISPTLNFGYVEWKTVLHPRLYVAARVGFNTFNHIQRLGAPRRSRLRPDRQAYELAVGYRLNRSQLLKVGYEYLHSAPRSGTRNSVLGIQFITSFEAFSKAFHRASGAS